MKNAVVAICASLVTGSAFGGEWCGKWTLLSASAPGNRLDAKIAFDRARGELILYGGIIANPEGDTYMGDTWAWNGISWALRATTGPGGRAFHGMVYDEARQQIVVHGGWTDGLATSTWTWDGTAWTEHAVPGPGERGYLPLAYDSIRQRVVLFGGVNKAHTQVFGDTWEWDGAAWAQVDLGTGATPRGGHASVFDSVRGQTVMFTGGADGISFADSWGWSGAGWSQLADVGGPSARGTATGAFLPTVGVSVFFGGWYPNDFLADTTWIWDGDSWQQLLAAGPAPSAYDSMTYDPVGKRLLLLRGSELWGLEVAAQAPVEFAAHPQPLTRYPAETAEFSVDPVPAGMAVHWIKNGVALAATDRFSGVNGSTLQISPVQASDAGVYRAVLTSICGNSATSKGGTLSIVCPADLNGDRFVDDADFSIFVSAYNEFLTDRADFNADAFTDDLDFLIFVVGYNELVCP